ncbi:MAG: hypothetical protein ACO3NZ_05510 [Pirellulales bacterium]
MAMIVEAAGASVHRTTLGWRQDEPRLSPGRRRLPLREEPRRVTIRRASSQWDT